MEQNLLVLITILHIYYIVHIQEMEKVLMEQWD